MLSNKIIININLRIMFDSDIRESRTRLMKFVCEMCTVVVNKYLSLMG